MNLISAFLESAARNADRTAIFWGNHEFTYQQLLAQSAWVAQTLKDSFRVKPGDRVAIWLKNRPEYVSAIYGVLWAGGVVVPINSFLKVPEILHILRDADIHHLISDTTFNEPLEQLRALRPELEVFLMADMPSVGSSYQGRPPLSPQDEGTLGLIIYTSGTTGRPKGAMLTHGNLLVNVASCRIALECTEEDRIVLLLPMFHSFMLCVSIFLPTICGCQIILIKSLHPPKSMLQEMVARQPTVLPGIPPLFRALADPAVPANLPIRLCVSGAAPLPVQVLRDFTAKFSFPLLEGYGLSEASPVVSINPIRGPWKTGSIGVPIPGVEVRIRGEQGEWLPHGQVGELCVKGGNVMPGYWNQPEATAEALRDGWLLTGDIGYRDEAGYFYITDRKKDMLLVNGNNVYSREIEEVVYQYPGIKEAAVVGRPDPRKGEQPVAFVVVAEGMAVEERALLQFVRERLADYKVPKRILFVTELPRNATGKVLKTTLRQRLAEIDNDL